MFLVHSTKFCQIKAVRKRVIYWTNAFMKVGKLLYQINCQSLLNLTLVNLLRLDLINFMGNDFLTEICIFPPKSQMEVGLLFRTKINFCYIAALLNSILKGVKRVFAIRYGCAQFQAYYPFENNCNILAGKCKYLLESHFP